MIVKSNLKIGNNAFQFEADEKDELEALHKAIVLASPHQKCDVCGDDGLENKKFTSNKATSKEDGKSYYFVNIKCKCGAKSQLGSHVGGGYFWKKYEKYEPKKQSSNGSKDEPDGVGDIS